MLRRLRCHCYRRQPASPGYSLWACGLLILSVSFSLKRHSTGCDGFQLPVLKEQQRGNEESRQAREEAISSLSCQVGWEVIL